ncbi:MAG: hypothetical protein OHK0015_44080 [Chloroflexi bacterium OHK40]
MHPGPIQPDTLIHGRYRVVRQVGRGGMGAVYEAIDTRLGNSVALKQTLVRGAQLDDAFAREARLLSSLRHPALPVVSDYFAEGESHFLVMQFIPGTDLATLAAQRSAPFGLGEVLPWADQLLDALDYLHTQNPPIVHRDIKPQNLKLTPRGEVVLLDFGLAKGGTGQGASLFGYTPQFAPLEQIRGTGTDPRSDLYSLGATLYALLAHTAPPNALERASAQLQGQPDPLRPLGELSPQLPRALGELIGRAMALQPADRPASAASVRADLAAAVRTGSAGASTAGMATTVQVPRPGVSAVPGAAPQPAPASPPAPPVMARATGAPRWLTPAIIGGLALLLVAALAAALLALASGFAQIGLDDQPATTAPTPEAPVLPPTTDPREQEQAPPTAAIPTIAIPDVVIPTIEIPDVAATVQAIQATTTAAFGTVAPAQTGPSIGTTTLEFGQEGIGDGFLNDPRGIAVGPDGAIYVADYSPGRVQRFSSEGVFERSWLLDDDRPVLALAADRQGRVFVAQNFAVSIFDGATGTLLGRFTDADGNGLEELVVLGDGSMLGVPWASGDLVRFDAEGRETSRIPELLAAADADGSIHAIAADGQGTIYALDASGQNLFIFGPDGAFRDRFSVPDTWSFNALAVDGQGRVYVSSFGSGIQVFAGDGRPLGSVATTGSAFALTIDTANYLYAATNAPRVLKVALNP